MTKKEFIEALHKACPEFMRDLESYEHLICAVLSSDRTPAARVAEKRVELRNKWPHSWCMISLEISCNVPPDLSNKLPNCQRAIRGLAKAIKIYGQAQAANVEVDPVRAYSEALRILNEDIVYKSRKESAIPEFINENEKKKRDRQKCGERLFSMAAIVIPVYPYTNKDDIDWEAIEHLKKHFYGQSYRPKSDQYEKIIKVFQAGQLLEEKAGKEVTAYKSWQEVADSVGLRLSTVRYIYNKAHQLVFGFPARKRHYGVADEVSVPNSPEDIPDDPGPKLKERLTSNGEIGEYKNVFEEFEDIDSEKCHRCQRLVASSSGKYVPHGKRTDDQIFICHNCLSPSS